jgi:hypothetical protein
MNIAPAHHEAVPGIVGLCISIGSAAVALSTVSEPVLHAIALLVTILAGALTTLWTYQRIQRDAIEARAKIEAAKVAATAIVVAKALKEHMKENDK